VANHASQGSYVIICTILLLNAPWIEICINRLLINVSYDGPDSLEPPRNEKLEVARGRKCSKYSAREEYR